MKKIFTLFVAMVAFAFCAKAQVTVILEAHDVWGDGSGYQLLLDADATAYGTIIPSSGALTTSGNADAATYAEFEYKIPENADGSLTTTNMVHDGSVSINIPAGTYDFCVTNPTPGDRMWIASGNYGRYDDYVFEAGKTYHFTVAMNGQNDAVTIEVSTGTGINEIEANGATVYPNPANNVVNVNANSNINNVEIYSISGQKVGDFTANGTTTAISTESLSNGMYLMKINTENGVINKKFSVAR